MINQPLRPLPSKLLLKKMKVFRLFNFRLKDFYATSMYRFQDKIDDGLVNPNWHEKCSSLAPPRDIFYKPQVSN